MERDNWEIRSDEFAFMRVGNSNPIELRGGGAKIRVFRNYFMFESLMAMTRAESTEDERIRGGCASWALMDLPDDARPTRRAAARPARADLRELRFSSRDTGRGNSRSM